MDEFSVTWIFENIVVRFLGLADILRFGLVSREHRRILEGEILPKLRVPLSSIMADNDAVLESLSSENLVLDCATSLPACWHVAARVGSVRLMQLLDRSCVAGCDARVLMQAITMDYLDCVAYICRACNRAAAEDGPSSSYHKAAVDCAARCGNIDMLAWLLDAFSDGNVENRVDNSAESIIGNSVDTCYYGLIAMESAAQAGNTHVVQWLVDSLGVPCTPTILRVAVEHDHQDVALWIFDNVPRASIKWVKRKEHRDKVRKWFGLFAHPDALYGRSP
jgi:hypothetical protein